MNYLTSGAELTSIADAIRSKAGTSEQLIYPDGFITAIGSISGGSALTEIIPQSTITTSEQEGMNIYTFESINGFAYPEIVVTFDGTEYTCANTGSGATSAYGAFDGSAFDWSKYPFAVTSTKGNAGVMVITETASTHTIKVMADTSGDSLQTVDVHIYNYDATTSEDVVVTIPNVTDGLCAGTYTVGLGEDVTLKVPIGANGAKMEVESKHKILSDSDTVQIETPPISAIITGDCEISIQEAD